MSAGAPPSTSKDDSWTQTPLACAPARPREDSPLHRRGGARRGSPRRRSDPRSYWPTRPTTTASSLDSFRLPRLCTTGLTSDRGYSTHSRAEPHHPERGHCAVGDHVIGYHRVDVGDGNIDTAIVGRYLDRLERREEEWRIAERTMIYDWTQDFGTSADWSQGLMGMPLRGDHYTGRGPATSARRFLPRASRHGDRLAAERLIDWTGRGGHWRQPWDRQGHRPCPRRARNDRVRHGAHCLGRDAPLAGTVGETAAETECGAAPASPFRSTWR